MSPLQLRAAIVVVFAALPSSVSTPVTGPPDGPQAVSPSLAGACRPDSAEDPVLARLTTALNGEDRETVRATLGTIEPALRAAALEAPTDVTAQYRLAALLGVRAEREGGKRRLGAASELRTQATRVLDLAPNHGGAHYLMGRLHAGVMRMDGVTRFLATRLFGGKALRDASWDTARLHLEAAERLAVCDPAHHFELARLYADRTDRRDMAGAARERGHALALTTAEPRWTLLHQRVEGLAAQWAGRTP
jgi:hypothetical protein